jgi:hypothetical protein
MSSQGLKNLLTVLIIRLQAKRLKADHLNYLKSLLDSETETETWYVATGTGCLAPVEMSTTTVRKRLCQHNLE